MIFLLSIPFFYFIIKLAQLLSKDLLSFTLKGFLIGIAMVIPTGYLLSELNWIGKPLAWVLILDFISFITWFLVQRTAQTSFSVGSSIQSNFTKLSNLISKSHWAAKLSLAILGIGFFITTVMNLIVLLITVPNEWDSMTGHLVKCAHYIQNGNMDRLQGTSWSIDFYPNSLPTLQIFGYHLFGETGFKVIHYLSYWIFALGIAAIVQKLFQNKLTTLFLFLLAGLLPSALIQAVTTETDIVQSAYLGLVVFLLIELYLDFKTSTLRWLCLAASIWISHKVTFLLIGPAIFVLFLYVFWKSRKHLTAYTKNIPLLVAGLLIYVLPNGYIANVKEVGKFSLGALSAPEEVMKWHGIENYTTKDKLRNFKLNLLRYTSDFIQLDGVRNTELGKELNEGLRYFPNKLANKFDLERDEFWVVAPFNNMGSEKYQFHKERPFWGIIGFVIFPWSLVLLFLHKKSIKHFKLLVVLLVAWVAHFLSLSFSAPYDPIKGRYFMNTAIWAFPIMALFFLNMKSFVKPLLLVFVSWAGIAILSHRVLYPFSGENSIFTVDRTHQITAIRPEFREAYYKFEELVPTDAIVALGTQQEHEDYIYPLWGKNFKRTLIPIHPFRSAVKPIPSEAEYLFYSEGVIEKEDGDIFLGGGDKTNDTPVPESHFYLRKLK